MPPSVLIYQLSAINYQLFRRIFFKKSFLGSPLVAVYALRAHSFGNLIFRPFEEEDLRKHFGAEYENYCKNVRCWIPNRRAFGLK